MEKKRLSKRPTRIQRTRKRTAKQVERDNAARAGAMQDFPPKPVSLARKIAARLKNIREREGISLSVLSERTGITPANLSRFENSSNDFKLSTLKVYADGLGVPVTLSLGNDVVIGPPKQPKAKQPLPATAAKRESRRKK